MKRRETKSDARAEDAELQRRTNRAAARRAAFKAGEGGPIKLLTEAEVAAILRCRPSKVKGLRMSGRLPYLPLRPPMIEEADLHAYIEWEKRRRELPEPTPAERDADLEKKATLQARRMWLRQRYPIARTPKPKVTE